MKPSLILLSAFAAISIVTFFLYGADKRKAKRRAWRTPESVLLGFAYFRGAAGALIRMADFRHKTKQRNDRTVAALRILWQVALPLYLHFWMGL